MCGVKRKDRIGNKDIRGNLQVATTTEKDRTIIWDGFGMRIRPESASIWHVEGLLALGTRKEGNQWRPWVKQWGQTCLILKLQWTRPWIGSTEKA